MAITKKKDIKVVAANLYSGLMHNPADDLPWIEVQLEDAFTDGRVSVLKEFDMVCQADAFMGFSASEWAAVQRFIKLNKEISGGDW